MSLLLIFLFPKYSVTDEANPRSEKAHPYAGKRMINKRAIEHIIRVEYSYMNSMNRFRIAL